MLGLFYVATIHGTLTWTTGSLSCTHMLMHAIAHVGVWTLNESLHWKLTLGRKSLDAPRIQTCISGVTVWCSTNWATSHPHAYMHLHDGRFSKADLKREPQNIWITSPLTTILCRLDVSDKNKNKKHCHTVQIIVHGLPNERLAPFLRPLFHKSSLQNGWGRNTPL